MIQSQNCRPTAFLTGHQHLFQTLDFPRQGTAGGPPLLPWTVIVGHGGTKIDNGSPAPAPASAPRCRAGGSEVLAASGETGPEAVVETVARHGFVVWRREAGAHAGPEAWSLETVWTGPDPAPMAEVGGALEVCLP